MSEGKEVSSRAPLGPLAENPGVGWDGGYRPPIVVCGSFISSGGCSITSFVGQRTK